MGVRLPPILSVKAAVMLRPNVLSCAIMGSRRCPDVLMAGEEGLAQQELKRIIPRTRESADHLAEMSWWTVNLI